MLVGTQLKLSDRRSSRRFKTLSSNTCHSDRNSQVFRPCSQTSLAGAAPKVSNVFPTPEKRMPEMRVVSLHLEDYNTNKRKILRSPHKMPSFCKHFKRTQRNSHRDEQDLNDDFLVRGIEVGNYKDSAYADSDLDDQIENELDAEAKSLQSGIQIQLTDCCQCVCDLFNSNFLTPHDEHDFNYVTLEGCNLSRPLRPKEGLPSQDKELLDPNILKVIRITMSAKN